MYMYNIPMIKILKLIFLKVEASFPVMETTIQFLVICKRYRMTGIDFAHFLESCEKYYRAPNQSVLLILTFSYQDELRCAAWSNTVFDSPFVYLFL